MTPPRPRNARFAPIPATLAGYMQGGGRRGSGRLLPQLDRADRRRLFFGLASDGLPGPDKVHAANRAEDWLARWEREGRVVVERTGGRWRILEPAPDPKR